MNNEHILEHPKSSQGIRLLVTAVASLLLLMAAPLTAKAFKEVTVECADGDSINRQLARRDTELVINIIGICVEDVVVFRDRVTLRGQDPAFDGIQAASTDDPYGAALFIRGGRQVNVENLQLTGGRHAGLTIEDVRRNVVLRNLRIEGNKLVGLLASNSLVVGFDLSITGNGVYGVGISETAYLRCDNCTIADNPSADEGYGIVGSAGALATLFGGSVSAKYPLSFRLNAVGMIDGTEVAGYLALNARTSSSITVKNSTVDGSIRADGDSQIELNNTQQVFNPAPAGNFISGASQLTVTRGAMLIGATIFSEFSNGIFDGGAALEELGCSEGSDAVCAGNVSRFAARGCQSC